jgi:hypothetical protein
MHYQTYLSVVHDFLGTDQETAERAATREESFDVTVQLPAGYWDLIAAGPAHR